MNFLISLHKIGKLAEPAIVMAQIEHYDFQKQVRGLEINANLEDPLEVSRLFEYGKLLKSKGMILQLHSPHGFSKLYNETIKLDAYLSIYNRLAQDFGQPLSVTIHPVESHQKEKARYHTLKLITRLHSICELNGYPLTFTLENLNLNRSRLDTNGIRPIILGSDVNFCWDIGHEVFENNCSYNIDPNLCANLNNVHIHDIDQSDHYPFRFDKTDYVKAIEFLYKIRYKQSVVVEINMDYLSGQSWSEKIMDYISQVYTLSNVYDYLQAEMGRVI